MKKIRWRHSRLVAVFLCSLMGSSLFVGAYAQDNEHAHNFCSYYDYSSECYEHRYKVSKKVETFVDGLKTSLQELEPKLAYARLSSMNQKLQQYVNYYEGSQWKHLIVFLLSEIKPYLDTYEEEAYSIEIPEEKLQDIYQTYPDKNDFLTQIRQIMIQELIHNGFDGFIQDPYPGSTQSRKIIVNTENNSLEVTENILEKDALDNSLEDWFLLFSTNDDISLKMPPSIYRAWKGKVYLFKNTGDLRSTGLGLVSHRERVNTDVAYRRKNIATSFQEIGHVRVLNPGDEISYLEDSNFDPYQQQLYEVGFVIAQDIEKKEYGGGLCGGSTAIYQGIVTNRALERPQLRNHSKRYHYLYDATIDGQLINTPGIDSTVYSSSLDLRIRNGSTHPIVLVLNYDGEYEENEEVFSLGYPTDKGWISHISSRPYHTTIKTEDGSKSVTGQCHTRDINGQMKESCYKEVKN